MAKVKLEVNTPLEGALKYALPGKHYDSTIPGKQGAVMYTLMSGDVFFLDEDVCDEPDRLFADAGIRAGTPFSLTVRKRNGQRFYELHNLATQRVASPERAYVTPPAPPAPPAANGAPAPNWDDIPTSMPPRTPAPEPSREEALLEASIARAKAQKAQRAAATATPAAPSQPARESSQPSNVTPIAAGHTRASSIMGAALISAIDACILAEQYARTKGIELEFGHEDYRCVAATLYIQACKDPLFAERASASQGASQWRQ